MNQTKLWPLMAYVIVGVVFYNFCLFKQTLLSAKSVTNPFPVTISRIKLTNSNQAWLGNKNNTTANLNLTMSSEKYRSILIMNYSICDQSKRIYPDSYRFFI
jgi:hypothetical protein